MGFAIGAHEDVDLPEWCAGCPMRYFGDTFEGCAAVNLVWDICEMKGEDKDDIWGILGKRFKADKSNPKYIEHQKRYGESV